VTAQELINHFNNTFGTNQWPPTYEVDHETYANCCQAVFDYSVKSLSSGYRVGYSIAIGKHDGLMFKGVELILKGRNNEI